MTPMTDTAPEPRIGPLAAGDALRGASRPPGAARRSAAIA